jgi:hypothetical protein
VVNDSTVKQPSIAPFLIIYHHYGFFCFSILNHYSLCPKKNDFLGFKICPQKNDVLLDLVCVHVHVDMQQSIGT